MRRRFVTGRKNGGLAAAGHRLFWDDGEGACVSALELNTHRQREMKRLRLINKNVPRLE